MSGYDIDDVGIIEKWWPKAYPDPEYREKVKSEWYKGIQDLLEQRCTTKEMSVVITCKDGELKYVDIRYQLVKDEMVVLFIDKTEQKKSQNALVEVESKYRKLFENSNDAVFLMEKELFVECNSKTEVIYGYSRDKIIGHSPIDFSPEFQPDGQRSSEKGLRLIDEAYTLGSSAFEWQHTRNDGTLFYTDVSLFRIEIGDKLFLQAVVRDITDRKNSENLLKISESKFKTIFNVAPYSISINRISDGKYISVNPAFERLSGFKKEDALGKSAFEIGAQKREDFDSSMIAELKAKGKLENIKMKVYNQEGKKRFILISLAMLIVDEEPCILSMSVDITERELAEEQLRATQKMDVIGQLAGGIAHDFNNMLGGIMGYAEILSRKLEKDSPLRSYADKIVDSSRRSADLTHKLLAFARKGKIISTPIDIHSSIDDAIGLLERSIDKKVEIKRELSAKNSVVVGDPTLLQNAFLNLSINARDAMPHGGIILFRTSNIFMTHEMIVNSMLDIPEGLYVKAEVHDSGSGIAKENIHKIFEPFFTTKEVGKGTGLGLSAVYGTVKEHKGAIKVFSELNKGTEFIIYLPVEETAVFAKHQEEASLISGKGKILIIDDEPLIKNMAANILKDIGYEIITADNGESGTNMFESRRSEISLILLDMIMPKMDGAETFRRLKEIDPNVKVLLSSGFSYEKGIGELINLGAKGFIQKPYRAYDLSKLVSDALK